MIYRKEAYTCWSQASGARVNNWGARIDLIVGMEQTNPSKVMHYFIIIDLTIKNSAVSDVRSFMFGLLALSWIVKSDFTGRQLAKGPTDTVWHLFQYWALLEVGRFPAMHVSRSTVSLDRKSSTGRLLMDWSLVFQKFQLRKDKPIVTCYCNHHHYISTKYAKNSSASCR